VRRETRNLGETLRAFKLLGTIKAITGGLGRRPRTDSASTRYGLFDRVTTYWRHGEDFPPTLMRGSPDGTVAGEARTILLLHIISVRPSKQPLMVLTFLKVYMEPGSYFLFLQEQIKDIIISLIATTRRH